MFYGEKTKEKNWTSTWDVKTYLEKWLELVKVMDLGKRQSWFMKR